MATKAVSTKKVDMTSTPPQIVAAAQTPVSMLHVLNNPGRMAGDTNLDDLIPMIEEAGNVVLEPLVTRPLTPAECTKLGIEEPGHHAVLMGRRRLAAAKRLKLKTVPTVLSTSKESDVVQAITENYGRRNMTKPETCQAIIDLAEDKGWDVKIPKAKDAKPDYGKDVMKAAEFFGFSKATIYRILRLGMLEESSLKRIHNGEVKAEQAMDMAQLIERKLLKADEADLIMEVAAEKAKAEAKSKVDAKSTGKNAPVKTADNIAYTKDGGKIHVGAKSTTRSGKSNAASSKHVKEAAKELADKGKVSKEAASKVIATTKAQAISEDDMILLKQAKKLANTLDQIIDDSDNQYQATLAGTLGEYLTASKTDSDVVAAFKKSCKVAN